MKKIPLLMDCDPGLDDAVAMAVIAACERVNLLGVVTVAGNQSIETVTANARRVLDVLGRSDVPVAAGAAEPLFRSAGERTEGEDALGLPCPEKRGKVAQENPISFYISLLESACEPVTVLATGPLTNLAVLVRAYPAAAEKIEKIVVMGGANISVEEKGFDTYTETANYNFCWDAEAAAMVFASGIPVEMVGSDLTYRAGLTEAEVASMETTEKGKLMASLCRKMVPHYRERGYDLYLVQDAVAAVCVTHPELFTREHRNITVDYNGKYTYGASYVDMRIKAVPTMPTYWVSGCDREKMAAVITEACRG